jgi:hypothetical protein
MPPSIAGRAGTGCRLDDWHRPTWVVYNLLEGAASSCRGGESRSEAPPEVSLGGRLALSKWMNSPHAFAAALGPASLQSRARGGTQGDRTDPRAREMGHRPTAREKASQHDGSVLALEKNLTW